MAIARRRTCRGGCGRWLYGPGSRCAKCQPAAKAKRLQCRIERRPIARAARRDPGRCPEHLAWIRGLPCAVFGCRNFRNVQAAHVRMNTGGGMGIKPPDRWTVPLCAEHHRTQHDIGHRAFDQRFGLNLRALAEDLARISPHLG